MKAPHLLIPRPQERAAELVAALEAQGIGATVLPVIGTVANPDTAAIQAAMHTPADCLIATSANAVSHVRPVLSPGWTPPAKLFAIGPSTAAAMQDVAWPAPACAEPASTEGLLAHPDLQDLQGQTVVLLTGAGGREALRDALGARGANVVEVASYRREPLPPPTQALAVAAKRASHVLLPSVETAEALLTASGAKTRQRLQGLPVVAPSMRVIKKAQQQGFSGAHGVADGLEPAAVLAAMRQLNPSTAADVAATPAEPRAMTEPDKTDTATPEPAQAAASPPAQPQAASANPAPTKSGRGFAAAALFLTLINLMVLGAAIFLAWRLALPWLDGALQKGESLNERVTREALVNERQTERLDAQVQRDVVVQRQLEASQQADAALAARIDTQDARLATTESAMADVTQLVAGGRRSWQLSEVEHLLLIANDRLQLSGDLESASTALQLADARMATLNDPALLPAREQLANELAQIAATPRVDTRAIALKLASLIRQVPELPLTRIAPTDFVPPDVNEPASSGAEAMADAGKRALFMAKQALKQMVVVRKADEPTRPLLPPEQDYFLRQNLILKMESARLALLRGQETVYRDALQTALAWVGANFDTDNRGVQALQAELSALSGERITQAKPAINGSLQAVQQVIAEQAN